MKQLFWPCGSAVVTGSVHSPFLAHSWPSHLSGAVWEKKATLHVEVVQALFSNSQTKVFYQHSFSHKVKTEPHWPLRRKLTLPQTNPLSWVSPAVSLLGESSTQHQGILSTIFSGHKLKVWVYLCICVYCHNILNATLTFCMYKLFNVSKEIALMNLYIEMYSGG